MLINCIWLILINESLIKKIKIKILQQYYKNKDKKKHNIIKWHNIKIKKHKNKNCEKEKGQVVK